MDALNKLRFIDVLCWYLDCLDVKFYIFRVRMETIMGTHNSIQLCVNMDTSNEQYVVMPIDGK